MPSEHSLPRGMAWQRGCAVAPSRPRRAVTTVYALLALTAMAGLCSLGADYGRVQLAKTELQRAADSAARAAVSGISSGITATQNLAVAYGGYNTADGYAVTIDATNDVEFGTWDSTTRAFTVLTGAARTGANAIRVTARRTQARGTAVPLMFAPLIGIGTCDTKAVATAYISDKSPGMVGYSHLDVHNTFFGASYNSSVTTSPSHSVYNSNGVMASNGEVAKGAGSNNYLYGNVIYGPAGKLNTHISVSGDSTKLTTALNPPDEQTYTSVTNPGGVAVNPNVSGSVTWQGGTYYFTALTMAKNATITFSGPATIYLNGNATLNDNTSIYAYNNKPANLMLYQKAAKTFTVHNQCNLILRYEGPSATFDANDDLYFCGSAVANVLSFHDRCDVFYDEALGSGSSLTAISVVK